VSFEDATCYLYYFSYICKSKRKSFKPIPAEGDRIEDDSQTASVKIEDLGSTSSSTSRESNNNAKSARLSDDSNEDSLSANNAKNDISGTEVAAKASIVNGSSIGIEPNTSTASSINKPISVKVNA